MAKRIGLLVLSVWILIIFIHPNATAQFWKRKHKNKQSQSKQAEHRNQKRDVGGNRSDEGEEVTEQPRHKKDSNKQARKKQKEQEKLERKKRKAEKRSQKHAPKRIEPQRREDNSRNNKKLQVSYPLSIQKKHYRVDVLAPIYLDELVKGKSVTFKNKVPNKAIPGLSFYEGVMIAVDSLKKQNLGLDIFIHDVSSRSESPDSLVLSKKLDSSDLVLASILPQDLQHLATYCMKRQVNFVSTLSPSDGGVTNNKFFTVLQPTLKTHCTAIMQKLAKENKVKQLTILYRNAIPAEENAFKYLNPEGKSKQSAKTFLCNSLPDKKSFGKIFDNAKTQNVVVAILDNVFADSLLKELSNFFPDTHFEIYGMPSWTDIGLQRRFSQYTNMSFTIPVPFNYDFGSSVYKYVEQKYTDAYGGSPQELVYRGYEAMMWYGTLLKKYGTVFNSRYYDISSAPFTEFNVSPTWDAKGNLLYNENKHVYWLRFEPPTLAR